MGIPILLKAEGQVKLDLYQFLKSSHENGPLSLYPFLVTNFPQMMQISLVVDVANTKTTEINIFSSTGKKIWHALVFKFFFYQKKILVK